MSGWGKSLPCRISRTICYRFSLREFGAEVLTVCFAKRKPAFGNIPDAFEFALHFGVFGLEEFGVGVWRHVNGRSEEDYGARKRSGQKEVIPGFLEGFSAVDADVKNEDWAAGFSGEHDGAGLGDVARAARTVDGEGAIDAFFKATSHYRQSAKTSA